MATDNLSSSVLRMCVCVCSRERTAHLLAQLSCELLQEGVSVERLYLLLQELRTAAHRSAALCQLFWKVSIVIIDSPLLLILILSITLTSFYSGSEQTNLYKNFSICYYMSLLFSSEFFLVTTNSCRCVLMQ